MPATQALLIANVVVFLLQGGSGLPLLEWFALWPPTTPQFEAWQVVTYGFLHGSVMHIAFNMLALYTFGASVERLFGTRFYVLYYFACVVSAAVFHLIVTSLMGGSPYPTVGASGGIFGLLLAYGLYFPNQRVMLLIPPIPMKARTLVIVFAVVELVFGVSGSEGGIAHFAHLGGMLGGWLMIEYRKRRGGRR
jgi:membrane associated rhomboid family serine protease